MGARGFFCAWGQAAVDAPPRPPGAPQSQAASQHHPGVFPARQSPTGGAQQVLLRLAEQPVGRALARFCSATTLAPAWLERCPFLRCLSPAVTRSRERRCLAYLSDSSCASPARLLQSPVRGLAAPHEAGEPRAAAASPASARPGAALTSPPTAALTAPCHRPGQRVSGPGSAGQSGTAGRKRGAHALAAWGSRATAGPPRPGAAWRRAGGASTPEARRGHRRGGVRPGWWRKMPFILPIRSYPFFLSVARCHSTGASSQV